MPSTQHLKQDFHNADCTLKYKINFLISWDMKRFTQKEPNVPKQNMITNKLYSLSEMETLKFQEQSLDS